MILPGNHVNILVAPTRQNISGEIPKARTILQDVTILAVDQRTHAADEEDTKAAPDIKSVTVLLKPEDAETLAAYTASTSTRLTLTLRNRSDKSLKPVVAPTPVVVTPALPEVTEQEPEKPKQAEPLPPQEDEKVSKIRTLRNTTLGYIKVTRVITIPQGSSGTSEVRTTVGAETDPRQVEETEPKKDEKSKTE